MMKQLLIFLLLLSPTTGFAEPASLAWWLLPDSIDELPHEVEEDDAGAWSELWVRTYGSEASAPATIMEQMPGVRWLGTNPDKTSRPSHVVLILNEHRIVEFNGDQERVGTIEGSQIHWSDNKVQNLVEFRRRRGHRRHRGRSKKISFGKVSLPPLTRNKTLPDWTVERLSAFLNHIPQATTFAFDNRDLSSIAQLSDPEGSALGFRYSPRCSSEERVRLEDALIQIEPELTCWMSQNPELAVQLMAVLIQKPLIECRAEAPMTSKSCGMATLPYEGAFFAIKPAIHIATQRCADELPSTILHEIFHLAGIKEVAADLDKASDQANACSTIGASLNFENKGEEFYNDLQVETRMFLFRKVRAQATKWQWSDAEKSFVMGAICAKMGDKYCSRRYFQTAAESSLPGTVSLPESTETVTWSSLAQFYLYDSVSEDLQRMHELVRYLHRDPNGTLLRRIETGTHRLHELYVARQALEEVKENRGVCSGETDEHILCEDLAQLVKSPWFLNP